MHNEHPTRHHPDPPRRNRLERRTPPARPPRHPLNAEGERQAARWPRRWRRTIDLVVSSDLARAARPPRRWPGAAACRCTQDPALRERCYGGFEGLLYSEIEQRFPREFAPGRRATSTRRCREGRTGRNLPRVLRARHRRHPGLGGGPPGKHAGAGRPRRRARMRLPAGARPAAGNAARLQGAQRQHQPLPRDPRGQAGTGSWGEVAHLRPDVLDELP
jgi:probable phosphoglycerate mutase